VNGRKRHILVDTLGLLVKVLVHPANIQEREGAKLLLQTQPQALPQPWQLMWVDGGYSGPDFAAWVQQHCGCRVEVVRKDPEQQGFAPLPRRWVVERTFAWLGKCRRLSKDYEQKSQHSETWIRLAMIQLMLRRT